MFLAYHRRSQQHTCIWLGQVFSKRSPSKCAHTILYHSFRLRWSLLVGRSHVGLSTTSVLHNWTVFSQKPLVTSQSYIHRLSAHLDTSKYTFSSIPKWLRAWVRHYVTDVDVSIFNAGQCAFHSCLSNFLRAFQPHWVSCILVFAKQHSNCAEILTFCVKLEVMILHTYISFIKNCTQRQCISSINSE